ncbi:MAG TPA: DNA starvation/stationary phase protection protein [Chthoniobacterales bacterium]|nr:DNA starvation/stationary phase protection protein [Chthoniobacterales bacterium]
MKNHSKKERSFLDRARPLLDQHSIEIQPYGTIAKLPIALAESICKASVENLNQLLADTISLRDMYKKHHWQVAGPTFYQLHLLYDKHHKEQSELVDSLAERIQTLGGISIAMAHDVAETTMIPRLPRGRQEVPVQISRLTHAHEVILLESRSMAKQAGEDGDDGTNDLLVSEVIRTNESQVWFLSEHVVAEPLVRATKPSSK